MLTTSYIKLKNKGLIIVTIIFFLLVNTAYYWEAKLGPFAYLMLLIMVVVYVGFVIALICQIYLATAEKFRYKHRLFLVGLLTTVLALTYYRPNGIINFDRFHGRDLFIAKREGSANCMTTLKLKDDYTFREINVCFGVTEVKGSFHLQNDTIYFDNDILDRHSSEFYKFAVIKPSKYSTDGKHLGLTRYKSLTDTVGHELFIIKNELMKLKDKQPNHLGV